MGKIIGENLMKNKGAIVTFEKKDNRVKDSIGSSRIRGRWLWENWSEVEEYQIGEKYSFLIFQKAYWMSYAMEFKGIKVFDLCDPDHIDRRPVVEMMELCDACTFSTQALCDYYSKLTTKPCYYVPDRLDLSEHEKRGEHKGKAKSVVWFGYSHNMDIEKTLPHLERNNLKLTIISDNQVPVYGEKQPMFIKYSYPKVHKDIAKFDMVILPEYDMNDPRQRYKSDNKDVTCWALGVPVVKVPEDIDKFMSADERNKAVAGWRDKIKKEYDIKLSVEQLKEIIQNVKQTKK